MAIIALIIMINTEEYCRHIGAKMIYPAIVTATNSKAIPTFNFSFSKIMHNANKMNTTNINRYLIWEYVKNQWEMVKEQLTK